MKKIISIFIACLVVSFGGLNAQKTIKVPAGVKTAFSKKFPAVTKENWEKEDGNYEANWGGKRDEDYTAVFTPTGEFIESANVIPVNQLPANVLTYIKNHYKGAKITEAMLVTDASGKTFYEAEVHKKDIVFDASGNFVKEEK